MERATSAEEASPDSPMVPVLRVGRSGEDVVGHVDDIEEAQKRFEVSDHFQNFFMYSCCRMIG